MGSIKKAGIWAMQPNRVLLPGTAIGIIQCKHSIDLRAEPCTASERVDIVTHGSECTFNGKRFICGEMWYRTLRGFWLFSLYVTMDDSTLPFI